MPSERAAKAFAPSPLRDVEVVFNALAHEARRHIVLLLSQSGGELPSGYLAARFQHSWPTTTRHLRALEKAGLVEVRREGRASAYRLNRERLTTVVEGWLQHLAPPSPAKTWTSTGPWSIGELAASTSRAAEGRATKKKKGRSS